MDERTLYKTLVEAPDDEGHCTCPRRLEELGLHVRWGQHALQRPPDRLDW